MSNDRWDAESTVSGDRATIPATIRSELGIDDGDRLLWRLADDGSVHVQVVHRQSRTFRAFDGYKGSTSTNVTADHDPWGVGDE